MRRAHCDGLDCPRTVPVGPYEPTAGAWISVVEGSEDPLDFCSWACLTTYGAHQELAS